ncbi:MULTISPECIES: AGE family epimerase/isomerase [unclassified Prevotella]|uniref:AGE family epimerase/isomerase n=1 Tax=unclassified Prevotella TaxID=2638335 RepID=UPI00048EF08F|nr:MULTISPECIES: AGE family epimerase/isomerase [unclassified Prevotella]
MRKNMVMMLAAMAMAVAGWADTKEVLRTETTQNLKENILPFWMEKTIDPRGGFYGVVLNSGQPVERAPKGAVLNARIVWTFAKAYRQDSLLAYKQMADRAAAYYISHFIDLQYGGVYWMVDCNGKPWDTTKQTYACAFGIYGLAEHYRATGSTNSLEAAKQLYATLEEKVHDKGKQGYIESYKRDFTKAPLIGVDGQAGASKTMNTHIHLLEAYTTLYQVWPDEGLKRNLIELIDILQTKLYAPQTHHLILYCNDDWQPIGETDSYGHDIETSWLMCEAAAAIGDAALKKQVEQQAVDMARTALREGLNAEGAMLYEKTPKGMNKQLSWWPQCETIIGCVNAWQITGDETFLEAALNNWKYVKAHFVDDQKGGWFKSLTDDGRPADIPKVSEWNCPYHNSRLAFELAERLQP